MSDGSIHEPYAMQLSRWRKPLTTSVGSKWAMFVAVINAKSVPSGSSDWIPFGGVPQSRVINVRSSDGNRRRVVGIAEIDARGPAKALKQTLRNGERKAPLAMCSGIYFPPPVRRWILDLDNESFLDFLGYT